MYNYSYMILSTTYMYVSGGSLVCVQSALQKTKNEYKPKFVMYMIVDIRLCFTSWRTFVSVVGYLSAGIYFSWTQ